MNQKGIRTLDADTRQTGMTDVGAYLKSGKGGPRVFSEGFKKLTMTELKDDVRTADTAASKELSNVVARIELVYAMALHRDADYAHASRRFMLALGADSTLRGLYEGAKQHEDAKNEK